MSTQNSGTMQSLRGVDAEHPGTGPGKRKRTDSAFQPGDRARVKTKHGSLIGVLQTVSELMCMLKLATGEEIEVETRRLRSPRDVYNSRKKSRKRIDFGASSQHKTVVSCASYTIIMPHLHERRESELAIHVLETPLPLLICV